MRCSVYGRAERRRRAGGGLRRVNALYVDNLRQGRRGRLQLVRPHLCRLSGRGRRGKSVRDREARVVDSPVLDVDVEVVLRLHDDAHVEEAAVGVQLSPWPQHVDEQPYPVVTSVVPLDLGNLDYTDTGEPVGPSATDEGHGPVTDSWIGDTGALDLDPRLDHVAHRPDAYRFTGLGELDPRGRDAGVVEHLRDESVRVDLEDAIYEPGGGAEPHILDRVGGQIKTHFPPPQPAPDQRGRRG